MLFRCLILLLLAGTGCGNPQPDPAEKSRAATVKQTGTIPSSPRSVTGQVLLDGSAPAPQKLLIVKDVDVCGKRPHTDERLILGPESGIRNAVISVRGIRNRNWKPAKSSYQLDQTGCSYSPHVQIVPINTPLTILNNDGILHNVHTYSTKNRAVNIAQPPARTSFEMIFTEPEAVSFRCDIHGWMSGWVVVVDHPFHALSKEDGSFAIDNVPPGTYTLDCWHELLGTQSAEVTISDAAPAEPVVFRFEAVGGH